MADHFENQIALITGGASGLGKGLCQALVARGARVIIADLDAAGAQALAEQLGPEHATALTLDVTDPDAVAAAIEQTVSSHGRIDILFNNAGVAVAGELQDVTPQMLKKVIDVNLLGAAYVTRAAYAQMLKQGSGHIVNIGSMYGLMPGVLQSAYAAAKHGLTGLTLSLAAEAKERGVDVTLICPGYIETSLFTSGQYASNLDAKGALDAIPFKLIDVDSAVTTILAGVRSKRLIVAFPGYVRAGWTLSRISQGLFRWFNARQFKKIRAGQ